MLGAIREAFDLLRHAVETAPFGFWPLVVATLMSWGVTQRAKFWLPEAWSPRLRTLLCQSIAFWTGLLTTLLFWPSKAGAAAGTLVGLWSPLCYAIAVRIVGTKFPHLREAWSQDTRDP